MYLNVIKMKLKSYKLGIRIINPIHETSEGTRKWEKNKLKNVFELKS